MKIIVTEIQKFADGTMTTPSYAYDNRNSADAKYHSILASAAVSALPVHSAIMFTEEGQYLDAQSYRHETQEETIDS